MQAIRARAVGAATTSRITAGTAAKEAKRWIHPRMRGLGLP